MKVRDIIKPQMTVLRFMYSKNFAEGYFQYVCGEAYTLAEYGGYQENHPYSFGKMKEAVSRYGQRYIDFIAAYE